MAFKWIKVLNDVEPTKSDEVSKKFPQTEHIYGLKPWMYWDVSFQNPGLYRIARVRSEALYLNYFTFGIIETPNQIEPVTPANRLAVFTSGFTFGTANDSNISGVPPSVSRFNDPLFFEVHNTNAVYRFESRVIRRTFQEDTKNNEKLPAQCSPWRTFIIDMKIGSPLKTSVHYRETNEYGNDHTTFTSLVEGTDGCAYFSAEDGIDTDFNDLVVQLVQIR